jgi:quinol monooxygenase YgiN
MSGVRVIVNITAPSAEEAERSLEARIERCRHVEATEEGCLQFEIYRSAVNPEKLALLEHWSSLAIYDHHWKHQHGQGPPTPRNPIPSRVEFYPHANYEVAGGIWVPSDPSERSETIRWRP